MRMLKEKSFFLGRTRVFAGKIPAFECVAIGKPLTGDNTTLPKNILVKI